MRKPAFGLVGFFLSFCFTALGAPEEPASVFGEVLEVRGVNLEIVVTDRDGNRISGLTPQDFRLRVDGEAMPIDFFSEVAAGRALSPRETAGLSQAPGVRSNRPVGTSYLVFIDEYFPIARDRNIAVDGILQGLGRLGPEDRMAVVAFNGNRIDLLSSWSQSPQELRGVLEKAKRRPTSSRLFRDDSAFRGDSAVTLDLPEERTQSPDGFAETSYDEATVRQYVRKMERSLDRVSTAVQATIRSFAKPPGRKVMLLLSGGWPDSPIQYRFTPNGPLLQAGPERGAKILAQIHETANLVGYTLYPVDIPGRRETGRAEGLSFAADDRRFLGESELHTTLEVLAKETGGKAMLDGASLAAFDAAIDDTRSYYWLGFSPDWQRRDSQHKIQVEVLKPGLKARYRKGFRDLSIKKEVSFQVESALFLGHVPGSERLQATLGPHGKARRGRFAVPLTLTIPMDSVTMIPSRGEYVAELELRVAVLDENGDRNEMPVIPIRLAGPAPPSPGQHAIYETSVKLRNESHDLILALFEPASGRMMSAVKKVSR